MYAAMVKKDRAALERIHDDTFVLIHMTGMRQSKQVYIDSIMNGTLNYYETEHDSIDVRVAPDGSSATVRGRSRVSAAVFGGGKHTWRLQLFFHAKRTENGWKLTRAEASTW